MASADLDMTFEALVNLIPAQVLAITPPPDLGHHAQAIGGVGQSHPLCACRRVALPTQPATGVVAFLGTTGDVNNLVQMLHSLPPAVVTAQVQGSTTRRAKFQFGVVDAPLLNDQLLGASAQMSHWATSWLSCPKHTPYRVKVLILL